MTEGPDPNPTNASMPWGFDFVLTPNGSIAFVSGVERLQQRLIRRILTNPREVLAEGALVASDYIFDQQYGIGAPRMIGQPVNANWIAKMTARIRKGVLVDEGVDSTQEPEINLFFSNQTLWAKVKVTLIDQAPLLFSFPIRG